jgi:Fic family protein
MNHVGKSTATIDLQQLVDLEIFDPPKNKGRGSKYSLKK